LHLALASKGLVSQELRCDSVDVGSQSRVQGENLEAVARKIRYDWLTKVAADAEMSLVATGHTAGDQAETVLFRLLRGTGIKGLSGIAARRVLCPGVELIRPFLHVRRKDILGFLEVRKQDYCHDRTNLDCRYARNRIRRQLIPQLAEEYNPAIVSILSQLAEQAGAVTRRRGSLAKKNLAEIERPRAGNLIILDRSRLCELTRHSLREMLHWLWTREGWPTRRMGFREWDRLGEVARGEKQAVDLPEGLHAGSVGRVVQIGRAS
jgi:tRNA(Ile)-lysidine synthase